MIMTHPAAGLHQPRAARELQPDGGPQLRGAERAAHSARTLRDLPPPRVVLCCGALSHHEQGPPGGQLGPCLGHGVQGEGSDKMLRGMGVIGEQHANSFTDRLQGAPLRMPGPCVTQAFERRLWPEQHELRQFEFALSPEVLRKLEERGLTMDRLWVRHFLLLPCCLSLSVCCHVSEIHGCLTH